VIRRTARLARVLTAWALAALGVAVTPAAVLACASCVASAYGDRTFNWAFMTLLLMPFAVAGVIGGVLAYAHHHRRRRRRWDHPIEETP
jgi:hypothetical protein